MTAIIIQGDARALQLPDETVDLIVTSPPYWQLRDYQDDGKSVNGQIGTEPSLHEYVQALLDCTREWARVLKPCGSLFVVMGDKYQATSFASQRRRKDASGVQRPEIPRICERCGTTFTGGHGRRFCSSFCGGSDNSRRASRGVILNKSLLGLPWRYALGCVDELNLILRAEIIWAKRNGMPESARDRVRRSHEQIFHFTRQARYYSSADEIRQPYLQPGRKRSDIFGGRTADLGIRHAGPGRYTGPTSPLGRLPGSVWEICSQPLKAPASLGVDHFAAYPMELPRRCVLGWSPAGGLVLDPFGGTGTTAIVADALGRTGISVDRSADYCRLARWRVSDPKQRAKALGKPASLAPDPRQEQLTLFGVADDGEACA
jgi:DNA modification methylase